MPKVIKKDGDIIDIQNMLNNIENAIEAEKAVLQLKDERQNTHEYGTLRTAYYNLYDARDINYAYYLYLPLQNSNIEKRKEFLENYKVKLLKKLDHGITGLHTSELEKFYKELDGVKSWPYCIKNIEVVNSRFDLFHNNCTFSDKSGLSKNRPLLGMFSINFTKYGYSNKFSFIIPLCSAKKSDINGNGEFKHDEIRIIIEEQEYRDLINKCNYKEKIYLNTNTIKLSDGRYYIGRTDIYSATSIPSDDFLEKFHLDKITSFKLDYFNKIQRELLQFVRDTIDKVGLYFWINFYNDITKEREYIEEINKGINKGAVSRKPRFVGKGKLKHCSNKDFNMGAKKYSNQSYENRGYFDTAKPRNDDMKMAKPINFVGVSDNISNQRSSSSIQSFGGKRKRKFDNFVNSDSNTKVNDFLNKADGDGRNFYTTQLGNKPINIAGASEKNNNQRSKRIKNN